MTAGTSYGRPASSDGHARDVAVVLAGLVRRAEDDLIELRRSDGALRARSAGDDVRREIVGTHF